MDKLSQIYTKLIADEVASEEVQKAKMAFIEENFSAPAPAPVGFGFQWKPALALSTLCVLAIALVFHLKPTMVNTPAPLSENTSVSAVKSYDATEMEKAITETLQAKPSVSGEVQVKSLSSQVGPTMIYQKQFSDVDVTVVWVFPKGA